MGKIFDVEDFARELELEIILPGKTGKMEIVTSETIRPGLQFAGYFEYFSPEKVQIMGMAETMFMAEQPRNYRLKIFDQYLQTGIPCVILARDLQPNNEMVVKALKYGVPIFSAKRSTTLMVEVLHHYLSFQLAPEVTRHGVLMDIYGVGIMLQGESGIGKSETALELIKRKHRMIADDVIHIKKIAPTHLEGSAPESTRYLMEIRGIGILDISKMYGISSVLNNKRIDLVIEMEMWEQNKYYERLGTKHNLVKILEVEIPHMLIPVRPGRNLAIVIEAAARYFILKTRGIDPAKELENKLKSLM